MPPRKALEFELRERDYLAYRSDRPGAAAWLVVLTGAVIALAVIVGGYLIWIG